MDRGVCRSDVNKKRYDTVTFLIGDKEFYALVLPRPPLCDMDVCLPIMCCVSAHVRKDHKPFVV